MVKDGEKFLGTEQNPEDSSKIVFSEDVLRLGRGDSVFLRVDHTDDGTGKIILSGEKGGYLPRRRISFFLECTLKNCPPQFAQMCSLYLGFGSRLHGTHIHPVLFLLLLDKKERAYYYLLTLMKNLCCFWSPKNINDFEAAVISAINQVFPDPVITRYDFNFSQCL